jgi:glucose-6-phosphate-specific signal transduction histidine kinase
MVGLQPATRSECEARPTASSVHLDVAANGGVLRLAIDDEDEGGANAARGSGLIGLKDHFEAMGGTIVVESPLGHGTALFVEFPVGEARRPGAPPASG